MSKKHPSWFSIINKVADDKVGVSAIEVMIYEEIGYYGINAADFIGEFNALDDGTSPVIVAINSPGGDVFDAITLNSFLQRLGPRCTARIDGMAASAASVIAVGAHQVMMNESAMMMIHWPVTLAYGNPDDLRKVADDLEKVGDSIVTAYRHKAPDIAPENLGEMLDEETWLSAAEAVALGLADAITDGGGATACLGHADLLKRYSNAPKALIDAVASVDTEGETEPKPDTEPVPEEPPPEAVTKFTARLAQACVTAGVPDLTEHIVAATAKNETSVNEQLKRIADIRALCVAARLPDLAADHIRSGISADAVRACLFERIIADSGGNIDNREPLPPDPGKTIAVPKASDVYVARRKMSRTTLSQKGA